MSTVWIWNDYKVGCSGGRRKGWCGVSEDLSWNVSLLESNIISRASLGKHGKAAHQPRSISLGATSVHPQMVIDLAAGRDTTSHNSYAWLVWNGLPLFPSLLLMRFTVWLWITVNVVPASQGKIELSDTSVISSFDYLVFFSVYKRPGLFIDCFVCYWLINLFLFSGWPKVHFFSPACRIGAESISISVLPALLSSTWSRNCLAVCSIIVTSFAMKTETTEWAAPSICWWAIVKYQRHWLRVGKLVRWIDRQTCKQKMAGQFLELALLATWVRWRFKLWLTVNRRGSQVVRASASQSVDMDSILLSGYTKDQKWYLLTPAWRLGVWVIRRMKYWTVYSPVFHWVRIVKLLSQYLVRCDFRAPIIGSSPCWWWNTSLHFAFTTGSKLPLSPSLILLRLTM